MAAKYFIKTKLTSNATPLTGALDNIDGVTVSASDIATVITDNTVYNYGLLVATTVESTPLIIQPDFNGTNFRWSLESLFYRAYDNVQIPEPASPLSNRAVIWVSNSTGVGDSGDLMVKINVSGTTKTISLVDWSA